MKGIVEERAAMLGEYIIESKATVRSTEKKFGVRKSTVHKDVSQRLKVLNPALYRQVREILDTNKSERHIFWVFWNFTFYDLRCIMECKYFQICL